MILENKDSLEYLYRFQEGKIKLGKGINTELDNFGKAQKTDPRAPDIIALSAFK